MSVPAKVPPGFRFHPTDEELVDYYLKKKVESQRIDLDVIREIDLYKIEPWDLQERCRIGSTDQDEWYFFSHKDKKYPTGTRTNRATTAGFWKATGRDKAIYNKHKLVGMRKTLVFYRGRAPNGQKTDWIMHEYRLENCDNGCNPLQTSEEGWAVCRVFKKRSPNIKAFLGHERDSMMMGGGSSSNCGFVEDPMCDFFNTDGLVLDSPKHTMNHHQQQQNVHNIHNNLNNALNGHPGMGGLMQLMGTGHFVEPDTTNNNISGGHFHHGGYPQERQLVQQLVGMHQPQVQQMYGSGIPGGQLSVFACKQELEQLADFHLSHELSPFMQLPQLMESPKISAATSGAPGGVATSCSSSGFNYGSGPPSLSTSSTNVGQHVRALIQLGAGHNLSGSTPDNPNLFNPNLSGHNNNNNIAASAASILASLSAGGKFGNHGEFDGGTATSVTDWRVLDRLVASQLSQDQHHQRHKYIDPNIDHNNLDPSIDQNPNSSSCVTKDQSLQLTASPEAFHGHGSEHTADAVDRHDHENSIASDEPNAKSDTIAASDDPGENPPGSAAAISASSPSSSTYSPNNDIDLWSFASKRT